MNYIFGKKAILDAIDNNLDIECVKCVTIPKELKNKQIKFEIVKPSFFNQFVDVNHQQVLAIIKNEIKHYELNDFITKTKNMEKCLILMVDENQDPRNFGSIIRSAAAFGVDAIIYKNKNQCQINDLVIKASMGAVYQLNFIKVANLNQAIDKLQEANFWVYASGLTEQATDVNEINFDKKSVIIVGNENNGISDLTMKKADFVVKISMTDKVQSLNISVATAILINKYFIHFKK